LATLVEEFDVFGVHTQYWMPLAVLLAIVAITIAVSRALTSKSKGPPQSATRPFPLHSSHGGG
jgi:hypothetical protein